MYDTNNCTNVPGERASGSGILRSTRTTSSPLHSTKFVLLFSLLFVTLLTGGCFESKVITSKVNDPDVAKRPTRMNGVFYALPRTVVKADVPVVRTDKEPGAFYPFTPCFFPNEKYIKVKSTAFDVDADKIKFDTLSVPDTNEIYLIKTQGGAFETRNLELDLTESGVLVRASAETTNEAIDIVTGSIKTGVGLIAKASSVGLLSGPASGADEFKAKLTGAQRGCHDLLVEKWTEYINDATPEEKPKLTAARPALLDNADNFKTAYEEAEKVFELISGLQDRRTNDVLNTTSPAAVSADTLKLVLDQLDKSISDLKQGNFTGTKSDLRWNVSFRLNPEKPNNLGVDLFTLSESYGVCAIEANQTPHNQGVQLDPRFKIEKECPADKPMCQPKELVNVSCTGKKVRLEMALGENGEGGPGGTQFADVVKNAPLKRNGDRGFYYRIPGRAIAFIKQEGKDLDLGRAPLSIAQLGEVVSLPASTGGRRTKYTLALYEASGGLKNFVMGSDALVKQKNIDDLTGAASTAIEAKGERKKAKAPADELQQLERQRKILEEKKKIRDLEKDLDTGGPGSSPNP